MSTRAMISALNCGGRISQRGDTAPAEELRCAIPQVKDLALERSCVARGDAVRLEILGIRGSCAARKGIAQCA